MGAPDRGFPLGLAVLAALAGLIAAGAPASAQTAPPPDMEPTEVVDVSDFADRAQRWNEARRRARQEALKRAEELAAAARTTTTTTTTTTTRTTTTAPPATTTVRSGSGHPIPEGTTEAQWHALRECESTQNYRAVNPTGRYRGAYQFSIRTWDWVAGMHFPDLVGVDPVDASPADQDKMAYKLYEINGWDPWPTCKKRLPS